MPKQTLRNGKYIEHIKPDNTAIKAKAKDKPRHTHILFHKPGILISRNKLVDTRFHESNPCFPIPAKKKTPTRFSAHGHVPCLKLILFTQKFSRAYNFIKQIFLSPASVTSSATPPFSRPCPHAHTSPLCLNLWDKNNTRHNTWCIKKFRGWLLVTCYNTQIFFWVLKQRGKHKINL